MKQAGEKAGLRRGILFLFFALFTMPAGAAETTIAVASNFIRTMETLVSAFESETGHQVRVASGSSGSLYAQITHGAPFDAYLSADQAKPKALVGAGRVVSDTRFTYAVGTLVLWSARSDRVDARADVLRRGAFNKLALANPRLAPYGMAAVEALENLGLADQTRDRWVQGENIAQTYQFVASGNAELGFVAHSQIMVEGDLIGGSVWMVPEQLYHPIRQDAVLLENGAGNEATLAFMVFLQGREAGRIIESFGYTRATQTRIK